MSSNIPRFHDRDGDSLSFSFDVTLPDNVRTFGTAEIPFPGSLRRPGGRDTVLDECRRRVPAHGRGLDCHGQRPARRHEEHQLHVDRPDLPQHERAAILNDAGGPGNRRAHAILPGASEATGGDETIPLSGASIPDPYLYKVTGLPAGLTFDRATRTVSGRPTATGIFTVTYTADDFDGNHAGGGNAEDTASQSFTIQVGDPPAIEQVRIVSAPTFDADTDGRNDTFVRGDKILVDVEYSEPVRGHRRRPRPGAAASGDERRDREYQDARRRHRAHQRAPRRQDAALRVHGGGRGHGPGRAVGVDPGLGQPAAVHPRRRDHRRRGQRHRGGPDEDRPADPGRGRDRENQGRRQQDGDRHRAAPHGGDGQRQDADGDLQQGAGHVGGHGRAGVPLQRAGRRRHQRRQPQRLPAPVRDLREQRRDEAGADAGRPGPRWRHGHTLLQVYRRRRPAAAGHQRQRRRQRSKTWRWTTP